MFSVRKADWATAKLLQISYILEKNFSSSLNFNFLDTIHHCFESPTTIKPWFSYLALMRANRHKAAVCNLHKRLYTLWLVLNRLLFFYTFSVSCGSCLSQCKLWSLEICFSAFWLLGLFFSFSVNWRVLHNVSKCI